MINQSILFFWSISRKSKMTKMKVKSRLRIRRNGIVWHSQRSLSSSFPPHRVASIAFTESTVRRLSGSLKTHKSEAELLHTSHFSSVHRCLPAATCPRRPAGIRPAGWHSPAGRWCAWWAGACWAGWKGRKPGSPVGSRRCRRGAPRRSVRRPAPPRSHCIYRSDALERVK